MSASTAHRRAGARSTVLAPAFTLVELLVVIGIIALLVAILIPALSKAKERANEVKCQSNMRQLMTAWLMFANDHKGHLPGNWFDMQQKDADQRDWLFGGSGAITNAPQEGTIFRYTSRNAGIYRCPGRPDIRVGIGGPYVSNGRFDYPSSLLFTGALVSKVPSSARFKYPARNRDVSVAVPLIVEEGSEFINSSNMDGGHSNVDPMSTHHRGGSYYTSVDGSVHYFRPKVRPSDKTESPTSWDWYVRSPGGSEIPMGYFDGVTWGWFNRQ